MIEHLKVSTSYLHKCIREAKVKLGGNKKLKIYGSLHCISGKRMKKENRVFFTNEHQAIQLGYRPCAKCMAQKYIKWKSDGAI
jgi:methylphosphotriester-DNA--protein-cysteine methyltransferase